MNFSKKISLVIVYLALSLSLNAQNFLDNYDPTQGSRLLISSFSSDIMIGGSPFINENWLPAEVVLNNGIRLEVDKAIYDAFNENLFIINEKDTVHVNDQLFRAFTLKTINGKELQFENRIGRVRGEIDYRTFLRKYYQGNAGLYSRYRKIIRGLHNQRTGYEATHDRPEFVEREDFYFRNLEGELIPIRLRERDVLSLFGNYEIDIQKFKNENRLDLTNPEDVIKAIQKYESLIFGS